MFPLLWTAAVADAVSARAETAMADLEPYPRHLAEFHAAPPVAWPSLVKALLENEWTVKLTQAAVAKVKAIVVPAEWMTVFLPVEKVMEAAVASDMTQPSCF